MWLLDCAPMLTEEANVCKETFAHNRMLTLNELNVNAKPEKLALHPNGERIYVQWPPFHEVTYDSEWLKEHVFVSGSGVPTAERRVVTWGRSDLGEKLPTIEADDLNNILVAREKLAEFAKYGILVIKDGAANVKALSALGYSPKDLEHNVVKCFSHGVQGLHTGGPFQDDIPALGVLVVRNNPVDTEEATLQLVDGFRVAVSCFQSAVRISVLTLEFYLSFFLRRNNCKKLIPLCLRFCATPLSNITPLIPKVNV